MPRAIVNTFGIFSLFLLFHLIHGFIGNGNHIFDIDWEAAVIDWESSRYTKLAAPRTAYQELIYIEPNTEPNYYTFVKQNMMPIIYRLGLDE